ncbi:hypothetical protein TNCV_712651 [Trichonephila clavipes]|nr:hypothetical protein TNCV_712651 [Trichonephila clavipes]
MLKPMCRDDTLSQTQAFEWHRRFGSTSVEDDECSERPQTSGTAKNIEKISAAVQEIFQLMNKSELSDLSDDDNAANKTYESRILEGESSSDENDEEIHDSSKNQNGSLKI